MRLLLATPLYPPDIAEPAPYVKELARRLGNIHEVTVLAYNHIPEAIPNVKITTVPKYSPLPIRLIRFALALLREGRKADFLYVQNGPSVELPLIFTAPFLRAQIILRLGDPAALKQTEKRFSHRILLKLAMSFSDKVIIHSERNPETKILVSKKKAVQDLASPPARPEILPFASDPEKELGAYNQSWSEHVHMLLNFLSV
jgi:hypothetical protein